MTEGLAFDYRVDETKYMYAATAPSTPKVDIDYSILSDAVVYRLRRAQLSVVSEFNDSLLTLGLRPADFSVLVLVANNSGLKQSDVAEALGIQRANFVAIIDGLEDKKLLQRRRSMSDRRVHYLDMTPEGHVVVEDVSRLWQEHENKLIDRLGGEKARDQLVKLLRRIKD
ncbi:DNA-binding MarR family transcriptional regulator [Rhizobium skierniewicense]|uniref:DNA-binding MarR family transcriptional regulator n=1 Tax=Rhizobium skierniewicense TaxID=984260 RepID=A0A7W6G1Z5_9HYPH|nr:MarR family winged helix-turn-helix transcriptional regulator [Rhizobium skierniewicense]MBB3945919.1 DNA-binding MarR family transcriptional regulator [Rhizobium skierniewicense]NTF32683.1 winged helix-turn-helix transcriptional regulator [Rhizobium skierniewicense]